MRRRIVLRDCLILSRDSSLASTRASAKTLKSRTTRLKDKPCGRPTPEDEVSD